MKKIYLTLTAFLASTAMMAQYDITLSNALPDVGESVTFNTADPAGFNIGSAGADQTWDYSSLTSTGTLPMTGHDSATAPKSGNVSWAFYTVGTDRVVRFDDFLYFYDLDGGQINLMAKFKDAAVIGQNPFAVVAQHTYNSPNCDPASNDCGIMPYALPATFGASKTTNQQYDWQNDSGADFFYKGTSKVDVDAHGSLTLPGGYLVENVMRVVHTESYDEHQNINFDMVIDNASQTTIEWKAPDARVPVVRYETFTGGSYETFYGARTKLYYVDATSAKLGFNSVYDNAQSLTLYPNPSKGLTRIAYNLTENADVEIKVLDMTGRTIEVFMTGTETAGPYNHEYDFGGLSQGTYFVELNVNGTITTKKLIVE